MELHVSSTPVEHDSERKHKKDKKKKRKSKKDKRDRSIGEAISSVLAAAAPKRAPAAVSGTSAEDIAEPDVPEGKTATAEGGDDSPTARKTFSDLGVCKPLCDAAAALNWEYPTDIQAEALPVALTGRDIIGLAETGSGKTGAFSIPLLQALLEKPQGLFACIMAPTRELAMQIGEQMEALGSAIGAKTVVICGGVDMLAQAVLLAKRPHIVVATPGRLVDHLENTKGFSLRQLKFLVLDEADRMLGLDFEEEINKVLQVIPRERTTYLFSATMTAKVKKLQRASLRNPVKCEVSSRYQTVKTLVQQHLFVPFKFKECYLTYFLNEFAGQTGVVFVGTCKSAQKLVLMLRNLGFSAICLHGQMSQHKRIAALHKFKAGDRSILVATDVAARGLDIPSVDLVVNYDVPNNAKDYVHRVGRTARAGRSGRSLTLVSQYDVGIYQKIEALLGKKLPAFPCAEQTVLVLLERVTEAMRIADMELREMDSKRAGRRSRGGHGDDNNIAGKIIRESQMKRKRLSLAVAKNKSKGTKRRRR